MLVKMEGHTPTTVNDSTKAMEIASAIDPDLITLDLMMPDSQDFNFASSYIRTQICKYTDHHCQRKG